MTEYPATAADRRKTVDKKTGFRYTEIIKRGGGKSVEIEIRVKPGLDRPNIVIETPVLTPEVEALDQPHDLPLDPGGYRHRRGMHLLF